MLDKFKQLFGDIKIKEICVQHAQLGKLRLDCHDHTWETVNSEVFFGGIPSVGGLPSEEVIREISEKLSNIDKYWAICSPDLELIVRDFASMPNNLPAKEMFKVSAVSIYPGYWEICFESIEIYKWFYIGMQFEGEKLVSNTIDT
ncbi:TPA: hypothetical protein NJ493_004601 [Vibrio parahaemolyticus]|nr:hypothetical protein [Vibrio parahaemolyticus]HCG7990739.1 hypothetical protein [Vibrio parahaemolyticus]HCH1531931.1 hypothetical protein [Vibrio parahaemolyticus]